MADFVFSSESVSEGHPDKVADNISDAILDAMLRSDPISRVACETFVTANFVNIGGEITCQGIEEIDIPAVVKDVINRIGYNNNDEGMWNGAAMTPRMDLVEQSPDIAMGTAARADKAIGAGDQGMMFGYAEKSPEGHDFNFMPAPIHLAHGLTKAMTDARKSGALGWLRPDTKSQVSVRYEGGVPVAIDAVVLAAQHDADVSQGVIQAELRGLAAGVLPEGWLHDGTEFFINHTGKFVKGGPAADTGLTGRKIIVDTYGGWVPHGGGAFSGKDATKVDRSAAYYGRFVAKNLVAAGVADSLQIQVAYAIGSLEPVSINVNAFGTGRLSDSAIVDLIRSEFSFAPGAIIDELGLRQPIFEPTAAYGHFGRTDVDLPWERLGKVDDITSVIGELA